MPTIAEIRQNYPQYSDMSDADLASALHKKFYADMPKEEFDKRVGLSAERLAEADPYKAAARKRFDDLKAKGIDTAAGPTRLAAQGMTLNAADEVLAAALTPLEMIRNRTWSPVEGYRHAKAMEDLSVEEGRKQSGYTGAAAEILGGAVTGGGLAGAGLTAGRFLTPASGLAARSLAAGADAAALGTVAGAMEGNSAAERGQNAVTGGLLSGVVGGATPGILALGGAAASPIISNVRARFNPEGYGRSQVARAIVESGQTPQQLADDVARAAQEGQGMFNLADAMGNPGQRMLSTTARAPGAGRTAVVEFLENRQAGQGRRVANALAEGFEAPRTAAQTRDAMTAARDAAADTAYGAARAGAGPVDLSRVIATIDDTLQPGVNQIATPASGIANDTIEGALAGVRARLTDGRSVMTDFAAIQRVRSDISDQITELVRRGRNRQAAALGQVLRELDTAMEGASQGFRQANRNFAQASRDIEAIDLGTTAARRGRTEDIIPEFQGQTPQGQAAYRTGYVDPLIQDAQGAAFGVNKARPLINDAFADESRAMAPGADLMQRRIGRENTMFETRAHALGGSRTADNLADEAAMGIDPTIIGQVLSGNIAGAARSMIAAGSNLLTGNTPQVREAVANFLLQRGQNVSPQQLQRVIDEAVSRIQRAQITARLLGRSGAGALAAAPSALGQR